MNYLTRISRVRIDYDGTTYCEHCGNDITVRKDGYDSDYCPHCGYYLDYSEVEENA